MIKTEEAHFIIHMAENMLNRLAFIHGQPAEIYNINFLLAEDKAKLNYLLQQRYADAIITALETVHAVPKKADLIFLVLSEKTEKLIAILSGIKHILKPTGLFMAGLLNSDINIHDIGDLLAYWGFADIVIDKETWDKYNTSLYLHAVLPDVVSVPVSQIKFSENKRDL